jgi:hypothetical protein
MQQPVTKSEEDAIREPAVPGLEHHPKKSNLMD